ncbi:hypothetical protein R3W88_001186 [Solanum pinnatisectum]|uniref:Uncharacterized protein n=3 Tax=Solanum TaxID=4107 RepID=A0ABQ7WNN0_SOLTU|nr:hypothetical protein KY289_004790 [Solanum tuberosum]KAH0765318.1 hypothetical protein KY285_001189 [Solanum tuberosum]KAH0781678.1 hypothetical protein KY290_001276 [Solanum tuberosum]KAK4706294.1 hypothetical protein R3W88_034147 [Solanum pinnatisectum]KAK4737489.1 hypothetical protein R3W88_001186 [Solanum pinnatisectum]
MGLRANIAVQKATLKSPQGSMYEWSNESTCFKPKAAKTAKYKQNDMFSGPS